MPDPALFCSDANRASSILSRTLKYFLFFRLEENSEINACNSLIIKVMWELYGHVPENHRVSSDFKNVPVEK